MQKFRVSYQDASRATIRNLRARVKANNEAEARALVLAYGEFIAIFKVEMI